MRHRRIRRGAVLVEALVVIAGLVALMAVIAADQRVALQETQDRLWQRRSEVATQAAVARALAVLQTADPNRVTKDDDWALLGDYGNQSFTLADNASFRMEILDAGSRVNINLVTEDQLNRLPLTLEQIDSLLDWREADLAGRPTGAKDDYYNNLPEPYNAKLAPFTTLNELLLVRGWTAQTLYAAQDGTGDIVSTAIPVQDENGNPMPLASMLTAESGAPNTQADGTARINLGQGGRLNPAALEQFGIDPGTAAAIAQGGPYSSFADLLIMPGISADAAGRLIDAAAFTNGERIEGKLNLNTATQAALESLPDMLPDVAAAIVSRQTSGGFNTAGEIASIPGVSTALLPRIADSITVGSDTWIVRAYGESGQGGVAIEATVGIRSGQARVLTWERVPGTGIPAWWNWQPEATGTVEAGAAL